MDLENYSDDFKTFYYWYISNHHRAANARASREIPIELVTKLSDNELELAKQLIFEKFNEKNISKHYYVSVLGVLEEKRAIPYIEKYYTECKEKHKRYPAVDFSFEIKLCKNVLKKLRD